MPSFTVMYGFVSLLILIVVAVIAYQLGGWKAALISSTIACLALVVGLFGLIALITRNM